MRTLYIILLLIWLSVPAFAQSITQAEAEVKLTEVNFSGIKAKCTITQLLVNGTNALQFDCKGNGFDRNSVYASFVYDIRSLGPHSAGANTLNNPNVCLPGIPTGQQGSLGLLPMIPGGNPYWQPLTGSNVRTLNVISFGQNYTDLATIGTMSVRKDVAFGPVIQLNPQRFQIQACGSLQF